MKNRTLKKIRKMLPSEAKGLRAGLVIVALRSICLDLCFAAFFQMCLRLSLSLSRLFFCITVFHSTFLETLERHAEQETATYRQWGQKRSGAERGGGALAFNEALRAWRNLIR